MTLARMPEETPRARTSLLRTCRLADLSVFIGVLSV